MGFGLYQVIDAVIAPLNIYPHRRTKADLAKWKSPPVFTWVVRGGPTRPPMVNYGEPQRIYDRLVRVEIHIWGRDYAEAEMMQAGLLTALKDVVGVVNEDVLSEQHFEPDGLNVNGYVIVQAIQQRIGVPRMKLPLAQPGVIDAKRTKTITSIALEPKTETPGDGELDYPGKP